MTPLSSATRSGSLVRRCVRLETTVDPGEARPGGAQRGIPRRPRDLEDVLP
jgi:hypothetical protein